MLHYCFLDISRDVMKACIVKLGFCWNFNMNILSTDRTHAIMESLSLL